MTTASKIKRIFGDAQKRIDASMDSIDENMSVGNTLEVKGLLDYHVGCYSEAINKSSDIVRQIRGVRFAEEWRVRKMSELSNRMKQLYDKIVKSTDTNLSISVDINNLMEDALS